MLQSGVTIAVTARNADGTAGNTYQLTVAPATFAALPAVVTAPALSGTGKIGTAVTVTAGSWSGTGTATSLQWRANGAAIAGATAASYTPVAADDGKDSTCLVSATSIAGTAQAATAALR